MEAFFTACEQSPIFNELAPRLAIFPLRPIVSTTTGVRCTCADGAECGRVGKHPACNWGEVQAHEHRFASFGGETVPSISGYGICTGRRSCLWVADLDGAEAVRAFYGMGPVPRTFTVRRGNDRGHLYFNPPKFRVRKSLSELAPGIDIIAEGAFAVGPHSMHKSGLRYEIADDVPVADAPEWLLQWPGLRQPRVRLFESSDDELREIEASVGARVPRAWRIARAQAWLATRPPAVSGEAGHKVTMSTLAVAARENLLTSASMILEASAEWNLRCAPPWTGSQLAHKVQEVLHRSTIPWSTTLHLVYRVDAVRRSA